MDAHDLHKRPDNLLDAIAADPGLINRPLPKFQDELTSPADQVAAAQAAPAVVLLHPDEHLPAPVPAKGHKFVLLAVSVGIFLMLSGGGAAAYFALRPAASVIVPALATPTPPRTPIPSPFASPSPTVSPSPTPVPTLSPSPTPSSVLGVTAPTAPPSADNPQMVTVTNSAGLWLRSTPNSQNKSNIIAWMPKGAQVSVDQTGDFWWHGAYQGKTGYFAVSYTK
ncbi:MAG: hypothetical protein NVSMB39_5030 [Candidatus Saccharimonadales bacterium]